MMVFNLMVMVLAVVMNGDDDALLSVTMAGLVSDHSLTNLCSALSDPSRKRILLRMMRMVIVVVTIVMIVTMTMTMVLMVSNPGHVPTRQSNERRFSTTSDHHGQVNYVIIVHIIVVLFNIVRHSL